MNKPKLIFQEGCFDNWDGTQDELDEVVAEITRLFESGELIQNAIPMDLDQLEDFEISAETMELTPSNQTRH